jgi:hypothetical protein
MQVTVLTVPDCPNYGVLAERLTAALAGLSPVVVAHREIADEQEAVRAGMCGSPTLLINGADPFAVPDQVAGLSCRIYRDLAGRPDRAPSVEALRRALEQASAHG